MTFPAENFPQTDLIAVRSLGRHDYEPLWRSMQQFTDSRSSLTPDEIWFTEHPPVFTLGLNASRDHLLTPGDIPVIQVDRGGQVTYHGPGQLMIYPLIDLKRAGLGVRGWGLSGLEVPWGLLSPLYSEATTPFSLLACLLTSNLGSSK